MAYVQYQVAQPTPLGPPSVGGFGAMLEPALLTDAQKARIARATVAKFTAGMTAEQVGLWNQCVAMSGGAAGRSQSCRDLVLGSPSPGGGGSATTDASMTPAPSGGLFGLPMWMVAAIGVGVVGVAYVALKK